MISLSLSASKEPQHQTKFSLYEPPDLKALFAVISGKSGKAWSPILWEDGVRLKARFKSCSYIALDFDTGRPTLEQIRQEMEEYGLAYILGTTKSHQVEKTLPSGKVQSAVDRFRLILKAKSAVTDREVFEYNMRQFVEMFGCDRSCTDAGRFFYPCKEIVAWNSKGAAVPWLPLGEDYVPEGQRYAERRQRLQAHGRRKTMPSWLVDIFSGKTRITTERHRTVYRIGCNFAAMGQEPDKAVALVMRTSLAEIGEADVIDAIYKGWHKEDGTPYRK